MTAIIDGVLGQWREEIMAEAEAMQTELDGKRQALAAAEMADRAERAQQRQLQARIVTALSGSPPAIALGLRIESATKDTTSGAVVRLRAGVAELERRIADCRLAIEQLDRTLAPDEVAVAA